MLKQSLIYLILSSLIILFSRYLHLLIVYMDILYTKANLFLAPLFNHSQTAIITRGTIILTLLPLLFTAIPALLYYAVKRKTIPYYLEAVWIIWLIIVISKIII